MNKSTPRAFTKREIVLALSREYNLSQAMALSIVERVFREIGTAIAEGRHCEFRDFGSFTVSTRKPRVGRNPHQPESTFQIPVRRGVKFRPGKILRAALLAPVPPDEA